MGLSRLLLVIVTFYNGAQIGAKRLDQLIRATQVHFSCSVSMILSCDEFPVG